ncbi:GT-D fold domain-containing glycosyltransferase [Schaedlerella arabinosiphila]|uniref:GT-D fold domain-containing glycosyltransferase n=1 Tax=Schaedlerella arabinosiphila TaxID=2044587 RepID=UPI002557CF3E|nr:GT-D fold domain-containing glycosyltransferase [Schaedlerella arabinosiphila]
MKKNKIVIWGIGKYFSVVYNSINNDLCTVVGIIDSNPSKKSSFVMGNIPVDSPDALSFIEWDYILVAAKNYQSILDKCNKMGINNNKIIIFWNIKDDSILIDYRAKRIVELEEENEKYKWKLENLPYELGLKTIPNVKSAEDLLHLIIGNKSSLCRFGDGEFEIIRGKERLWYQNVDAKLSIRLKEILQSNENNIIIAIANNFGNLDCYTEESANAIRQYLYGNTRKEIVNLLNKKRIYYDAYVSRPYIMYKDKTHANKVFNLLKKIWHKRNILIVEGYLSKMGVGNHLFSGANKIRRILCPETNAFNQYDAILSCIKKWVTEDELVLISLGPTATVLAYDLAKNNIQALDIGQIDNEYEWFLHKVSKRTEIPGKRVAELSWYHQPSDKVLSQTYKEEIIEQIGIG